MHILPYSTTSCSKCIIFSRFLCETELPLQYCAHFADLIFQKCSETLNFFLTIFKCNRSSRNSPVQPVHVLSTTFCRSRPATVETETLYSILRRPQKPLYPQKHRVSRPSLFSNLNSRVPAQLLDDDVT